MKIRLALSIFCIAIVTSFCLSCKIPTSVPVSYRAMTGTVTKPSNLSGPINISIDANWRFSGNWSYTYYGDFALLQTQTCSISGSINPTNKTATVSGHINGYSCTGVISPSSDFSGVINIISNNANYTQVSVSGTVINTWQQSQPMGPTITYKDPITLAFNLHN